MAEEALRTVHALLGCRYCRGVEVQWSSEEGMEAAPYSLELGPHYVCFACGQSAWSLSSDYADAIPMCSNPECGEEIQWMRS